MARWGRGNRRRRGVPLRGNFKRHSAGWIEFQHFCLAPQERARRSTAAPPACGHASPGLCMRTPRAGRPHPAERPGAKRSAVQPGQAAQDGDRAGTGDGHHDSGADQHLGLLWQPLPARLIDRRQCTTLLPVGMLRWIRHRREAAHRIILTARIHQVVIIGTVCGSSRMWVQVINTQSGFTVRKPAFAAETVHTLKGELVTQARLIRGVVPVAVRSMAPYVHDIGVVENLHVKLLQDRVGVARRRI